MFFSIDISIELKMGKYDPFVTNKANYVIKKNETEMKKINMVNLFNKKK